MQVGNHRTTVAFKQRQFKKKNHRNPEIEEFFLDGMWVRQRKKEKEIATS